MNVRGMSTRVSSYRRTQAKQVSNDGLMGCSYDSTWTIRVLRVCAGPSNVCLVRTTKLIKCAWKWVPAYTSRSDCRCLVGDAKKFIFLEKTALLDLPHNTWSSCACFLSLLFRTGTIWANSTADVFVNYFKIHCRK